MITAVPSTAISSPVVDDIVARTALV